ncbi:MAG: alpha-amylase, partial [Bacteroidota bacterium]
SESPYTFSRVYVSDEYEDAVIVGLDLEGMNKEIAVGDLFEDGTELKDYYSGQSVKVEEGKVQLRSNADIILLGITN